MPRFLKESITQVWSCEMKADDLVRQYIEEDPVWSTPGEARLKGHGVEVWSIISYLRAMSGDVDQVAAAHHLPREAVQAAVAYYRQHKRLIDAEIDVKTIPAA